LKTLKTSNDIKEYKSVYSRDKSELDKKVNELISAGFQPFGSISISISVNGIRTAQAMIKYY